MVSSEWVIVSAVEFTENSILQGENPIIVQGLYRCHSSESGLGSAIIILGKIAVRQRNHIENA